MRRPCIWWNRMDYGWTVVLTHLWRCRKSQDHEDANYRASIPFARILSGSEIVNLPAASWKSLGWSRHRFWRSGVMSGQFQCEETSKSWAQHSTCLLNTCIMCVCVCVCVFSHSLYTFCSKQVTVAIFWLQNVTKLQFLKTCLLVVRSPWLALGWLTSWWFSFAPGRQVLQTIVVPLSRSHTVRVTYVGVQAGTWIQIIHRSIWLMDFEDFQESVTQQPKHLRCLQIHWVTHWYEIEYTIQSKWRIDSLYPVVMVRFLKHQAYVF